jgi:hypothetical protein
MERTREIQRQMHEVNLPSGPPRVSIFRQMGLLVLQHNEQLNSHKLGLKHRRQIRYGSRNGQLFHLIRAKLKKL